MKHLNLVIIALLFGITVYSVTEYISSVKNMEQFKNQISILENENQNLLTDLEKDKVRQESLSSENETLKNNISTTEEKLSKLEVDFNNLQQNLSLLETENQSLKDNNQNLNTQVSQLSEERELLLTKMNSLTELKKMINALKSHKRSAPALQSSASGINESFTKEIAAGNLGYTIKNGTSTYSSKVKIDVRPVEN